MSTAPPLANTSPSAHKSYFKEALKLSLPLVISQFLIMANGFICNLMLSRVSESAFAAGLFINTIQMILVTVVFGLLSSLSPLIGIVTGQGKPERVGQLFIAGCIISLILSFSSIAILIYIEPIMLLLGQPENLAHLCAEYFRIYLWSVPAAGLITVFIQLFLGTFKQVVVFLYSIGNLLLSSVLSYILIFGKFGFPAMGLEGLAWAISITSCVAVLSLGCFIFRSSDYKDKKLTNLKWQFLKQDSGRIIRLGFPISLHVGNEMFSFLFIIIMVGWISIEALNMQQVVTRYLMMLAIPIFGLSQAVTVAISKQFGEEKFGEVINIGRAYIRMGVIYSSVVLLLFATIPDVFIRVFIDNTPQNTAIYKTLSIILILVAIGQVFDAIKNIVTGSLRGLHDTKFPMLLSFITVWPIGVPLAYLMGFTFEWGLIGITIAHSLAIAFSCIFLYWRWIQKSRNMAKR
ncbi:MATE family efflux transporter [Vibrio rhizosphaerae]|uniref:MATE family efflux transporter n=1 Tax=Vibrio rhizosphaerae TaxID=398736 RepID=UPI00068DEAF3|nr:MATE family efflux transporter [Vibrio rhizosphaerae]